VDSPEDGARLASPQFRSAVAEGIGNALIQFLLPGSVIGYEVVSAPAKRVSPNKKKTKRKHRA
jgi:hypothetical protein